MPKQSKFGSNVFNSPVQVGCLHDSFPLFLPKVFPRLLSFFGGDMFDNWLIRSWTATGTAVRADVYFKSLGKYNKFTRDRPKCFKTGLILVSRKQLWYPLLSTSFHTRRYIQYPASWERFTYLTTRSFPEDQKWNFCRMVFITDVRVPVTLSGPRDLYTITQVIGWTMPPRQVQPHAKKDNWWIDAISQVQMVTCFWNAVGEWSKVMNCTSSDEAKVDIRGRVPRSTVVLKSSMGQEQGVREARDISTKQPIRFFWGDGKGVTLNQSWRPLAQCCFERKVMSVKTL